MKLSEVETEGLSKAKHCESESPGNYVPCARHASIELIELCQSKANGPGPLAIIYTYQL